jgi:hypothetical protein
MSDPHLPPSPFQIRAQQRELVRTAALSEASTPLQGTTVSTLIADSSLVDLPVVSGVGEDTTLLPLTSIFHCPFIEESANSQSGKKGWLCKWCGKMFSPRHHSWSICHVLKIKLSDIAICTSSIPKEYEDRYRALYARSTEQMASNKHSNTQIDDAMAITQTLAVANLLRKRGVAVSGATASSPSMSIHSSPLVQSSLATKVGARASPSSISTSTRGSMTSTLFALSSQSSISASIQNMDLCKSHNAIVEMAIADFFHCENIPDAVVESPRFKRLVKMCHLVGENFVVPNCKKNGGELLDVNYEITYSLNKTELLKEAKVFGFAWMGNDATIH